MSRLVDPRICPDCRAPLGVDATCTRCGLRLGGPLAEQLWHTMAAADGLVGQLRRQSVPARTASVGTAAPGAPARSAQPPAYPPPYRPVAPPSHPRVVTDASAPAIVLGLGALCLLVAAVVFVAVAWSGLGLAAKTAILLGLTGVLGGLATWVTRRALRGAAETFWALVAGMLTLDITAAHGADLAGLGALPAARTTALVGVVLFVLGAGVAVGVAALPLRRLVGVEVIGILGLLLATLGLAWAAPHAAGATALSLPVLLGVAAGLRRSLPMTAYGALGVAGLSWWVLVAYGLDATAEVATDRLWWTGLHGWPFLVTALAAGVVALLAAAHWIRVAAAVAGLVTMSLLAAGPSGSATSDLVTACLVIIAWAAVSALAPRVWAQAAAGLGGLGGLAMGGGLLARPMQTIRLLPTTADAHHADLGLTVPTASGLPAAWTSALMAVAVVVAGLSLLRHVPGSVRAACRRTVLTLSGGVLLLGVAGGILELGPGITAAIGAFLVALVATGFATTALRHEAVSLAAGAALAVYLLVVMLRIAVVSHLLVALLTTLVAVALAAAYAFVERDLHGRLVAPALAVAAVLLGGFAAMHWSYVLGLGPDARAVVVTGVAVVVGLGANVAGRTPYSRIGLEGSSLAVGALAIALPEHGEVVAMIATVVGTTIALVAIVYVDRAWASWIGVAVLGSATILRVVLDVRAPELYTLPAALLLLGAGVVRMRRDGAVDSFTALGSGLTLALAPSLLLALDEPVSLRALLIGAAGLVVLAVGIVRLWSAPFAAGAITVGVLALRHLGPIADAIPRWVSLGAVGVALLLVGVTWESRRRDLAAAGAYLAELR